LSSTILPDFSGAGALTSPPQPTFTETPPQKPPIVREIELPSESRLSSSDFT
jgi:hypothetical protein